MLLFFFFFKLKLFFLREENGGRRQSEEHAQGKTGEAVHLLAGGTAPQGKGRDSRMKESGGERQQEGRRKKESTMLDYNSPFQFGLRQVRQKDREHRPS